MSKITLKNDVGVVKRVPVGFSWTMFFFGPLVPLFRGDIKWTIIYLLVVLVTLPLYGIGCIVLPFIYEQLPEKNMDFEEAFPGVEVEEA